MSLLGVMKTWFCHAARPGDEPSTFSKSVCNFDVLVVVVFSFVLQRGKFSAILVSLFLLGSREGEGGIIFTLSFSLGCFCHFGIKSSDGSLGCAVGSWPHPASSLPAPKQKETFDKKRFDGNLCLVTLAQIRCRQWKHFTHKGKS